MKHSFEPVRCDIDSEADPIEPRLVIDLSTHPRRLFKHLDSDLRTLVADSLSAHPVSARKRGRSRPCLRRHAVYFHGVMLNMFNAFLQLLLDILATYYLTKGMTDKRVPWLVFMYVSFGYGFLARNAFAEQGGFVDSLYTPPDT